MSYQLNLDFRTPEEKIKNAARIKELNDKVEADFYKENFWDKVKKHIPFGYRISDFYFSTRWWIKCTYQKIRYGVSDDDVFSLYHNIAKFILPRLKYFKKSEKKGIPMEFVSFDYHLLSDQEMIAADEKSIKEWNAVLDEMIFAFEYIVDDEKYAPFPDALMKKWDDKNDFNLPRTDEEKQAWKEYMTLCEKLEERKKKGLELFHKHFDNLWI